MSRRPDAAGALRIEASPRRGPLWQPREIRIDGAVPGSLVTVRATTERAGAAWIAQATYLADDAGRVDLGTDAPIAGDYGCVDAMGLFWSQRRAVGDAGSPAPEDAREPLVTTLVARAVPGTGLLDGPDTGSGAEPAEASADVEQWLLADGVTRTEVRTDGLVGTLFRPDGTGPFPTAIVLNGSGGGIPEARAALYASQGIQAFALGYFRAPGLPDYISRTPLEYFERALAFAIRELDPAGGRPVVTGQSRGGELTLLLGALFPERIAGLVAFVPSAFVCGAQGAADPAEGWDGPTWTWRGEPLEHLWHDNAAVTWQPWGGTPAPDRHANVYVDGLQDRPLARQSRIPIERFPGPVACVSGIDDRAWPSSLSSRLALSTLRRHGHTAERLHLDYADAGHGIGLPFLPATDIERIHPVSAVPFSSGGTPRGNADAAADSFERVCAFIHRAATRAS